MTGLRAIMVAVDYEDLLAVTLPYNAHHFDEVWIITDLRCVRQVALEATHISNTVVHATDLFYADGAKFNKWRALEWGLDQMGRHGWLCVAPWMKVEAAGIDHASRRWYTGKLVQITTLSGNQIAVTPDHKVLTGDGWISAESVRQGDYLFRVNTADAVRAPQINQHPANIGQIVDALFDRSPQKVRAVNGRMNLEGYTSNGDIDVVRPDRKLAVDLKPASKGLRQLLLETTDRRLLHVLGLGHPGECLLAAGHTLERCDYSGNPLVANFSWFLGRTYDAGLTMPSYRYTSQPKMALHGSLIDTQPKSQATQTLTGSVTPDDVVSIKIISWSGHVYDLSTRGGWFTANNLIIHNCLMDADVLWPRDVKVKISKPNGRFLGLSKPGQSFHIERGQLCTPLRRMWDDWPTCKLDWDRCSKDDNSIPPEYLWPEFPVHRNVNEWAGYSQIFHAEDPALGPPPWHEINWTHAGGADSLFQRKWPAHLKVRPPWEVLHLGSAGKNWMGRATPRADGTVPEGAEEKLAAIYGPEGIWHRRHAIRAAGGTEADTFKPEKLI